MQFLVWLMAIAVGMVILAIALVHVQLGCDAFVAFRRATYWFRCGDRREGLREVRAGLILLGSMLVLPAWLMLIVFVAQMQ